MTKKLKILHLIEDSRIAGPQLRIIKIAKALTRETETIVCSPEQNSSQLKEMLENGGVNFIHSKLIPLTKGLKGIFLYIILFLPTIMHLKMLINKVNPDIIHCSGGAWQIRSILAAIISRKKTIWHLNDTGVPLIFKITSQLILPSVNHVICASNRVAQYYKIKSLKKVTIIDAPVDFSALPDIHIDNNQPIKSFVTTCSISPVKGLDIALKAFSEVKEAGYRNFTFTIIGPVYQSQLNYYTRLKKMRTEFNLDSEVLFFGNSNQVFAELIKHDCYVCSSSAEASPTSVWEAAAAGLDIVSFDVGNIAEKIGQFHNVKILKEHKVDSLAIGLASKLNTVRNQDSAKKLSLHIEASNSVTKISDLTLRTYKMVLEN